MNKRDMDHFAGCLLGGAVGDALGAPVEFMPRAAILMEYGPGGVTGVEDVTVPGESGEPVARFTDDTQMTLFTAEGLLRAASLRRDRGISNVPAAVHRAYIRWLHTQGVESEFRDPDDQARLDGWMLTLPGLNARRGPGNTCLSALSGNEMGTIDRPVNSSKGCGGVMRVAPVGLLASREDAFLLGCETAAITHGHPSGYLAAGFLAATIAGIVAGETVERSVHSAATELRSHAGHEECLSGVEAALSLAGDESTAASPGALETLGEGWVAEEALAISLFCALCAGDDFAAGVCLAVNHGGDSDSTGAITGNILGAMLGKRSIPAAWLEPLEMRAEIEQVAADLLAPLDGPGWSERYPTC